MESFKDGRVTLGERGSAVWLVWKRGEVGSAGGARSGKAASTAIDEGEEVSVWMCGWHSGRCVMRWRKGPAAPVGGVSERLGVVSEGSNCAA